MIHVVVVCCSVVNMDEYGTFRCKLPILVNHHSIIDIAAGCHVPHFETQHLAL